MIVILFSFTFTVTFDISEEIAVYVKELLSTSLAFSSTIKGVKSSFLVRLLTSCSIGLSFTALTFISNVDVEFDSPSFVMIVICTIPFASCTVDRLKSSF